MSTPTITRSDHTVTDAAITDFARTHGSGTLATGGTPCVYTLDARPGPHDAEMFGVGKNGRIGFRDADGTLYLYPASAIFAITILPR